MTFLTVLAVTFFFVAGFGVYKSLLFKIGATGGRVRANRFGNPDLAVALILTGLITALVALWLVGSQTSDGAMDVDKVLPGVLPFLILMIAIIGFLRLRRLDLRDLFGFERISPGRAFLLAFGLLLAAFPLVIATAGITSLYIQNPDSEQPLVKLFRELGRNGDFGGMAKVFVAAVVLAPLVEEFLFRGYFYGVLKRYCGGFASAVFTAALFGAFHMNLPSLPSLMVLALCLTIAYEATGCLWVPIAMHGLFNFSQLIFLYWNVTAHAG